MTDRTTVDSFTEFVEVVEPRLKRALVAAFGRDVGLDAAADALAHGWERWDKVRKMENPGGYLWGVGRNMARSQRRPRPVFPEVPVDREPWVEPGLPSAIAGLSESQRTAVLLIHGFEWTHAEVAELLGISNSSVQRHAERGMAKLRRKMGSNR